jgi:glycosyltransferase involved in cell wall biosynthesis
VSVASWRNHGKAPHRVADWAAENGPVRFFGDGIFAPPGSQGVPYQQMPELLASFERFVYLPNVIEPFGRLVAEAWAAGCELVINGNVGAAQWIQESPEAIENAGEDFWGIVLEGATRS